MVLYISAWSYIGYYSNRMPAYKIFNDFEYCRV